ncbi:MAG: NUDIX domain-containing protein [Gammaproteobacteria bacterium]|nr:NUDIX domain-containing protein [Gammaproteobacteria bacterium]
MSDKTLSRPVIGVGVLVWRDKQLLLGKRISEQQDVCWQFPGGHLENDESVIQCASREVLEETGLKIKALRHLGFTDKAFSIGQRQYITLLVSCDHETGEAQTLEPDKCEVWQWFDYQDLPTPLFQPIEIFISQQPGSQQRDLYDLHRASQIMSST